MRPDVDPDGDRAVAEWLQSEIGVPFVVVGGSAIEIEVAVATKDVDILVSGRGLAKVDSAMEGRKDAYPLEPTTGTIRGTEVSIGRATIPVDFLSAGPFGGDDFFRYVRDRGSEPYRGDPAGATGGSLLHAPIARRLAGEHPEHRARSSSRGPRGDPGRSGERRA